jgi:hypothetical protein
MLWVLIVVLILIALIGVPVLHSAWTLLLLLVVLLLLFTAV